MGQRLLIVESDRTFLKECQVNLESAFEIEQASSPDGVMAKVESGEIAAVLISVEISENKGYALCSALRKNPALANLKIILISSKATEEEYRRHQSLKGRADLYLHKPIAPTALVEALTPLVPARKVDPDNPLGDLADGDFGSDDWLSDLRSDLESDAIPVVPATATQPLAYPDPTVPQPFHSPNQTIALSAGMIHQAIALDAGTGGEDPALKARVDELQALLSQRDAKVAQLEQDYQHLQREHDSVTQNLDDLARRQTDAQELQRKLSETEQALKRFEDGSESGEALRNQLREGMKERHDLLQQIDSTNTQLAEKTQKVIDLMKERDRHQQKALDDQVEMERLAGLERTLIDLQAKATATEQALEAAKLQAEKVGGLEEALNQSRGAEHEAREALAHVEAGLETTTAQVEALTADKARLEAKAEELAAAHAHALAQYTAKADEVAGLETTMRSQGRDLVDLHHQVGVKDGELKQLQERFDQQLLTLQTQEAALSEAQAGQQAAETRAAGAEAALAAERERFQAERAELVDRMNGELLAKDAELEARNKSILDLQDLNAQHQASLEAAAEAKSRLEAQLAQAQDRVLAMAGLFNELEGTLRKAAEL